VLELSVLVLGCRVATGWVQLCGATCISTFMHDTAVSHTLVFILFGSVLQMYEKGNFVAINRSIG
jgi:hypothetical protein